MLYLGIDPHRFLHFFTKIASLPTPKHLPGVGLFLYLGIIINVAGLKASIDPACCGFGYGNYGELVSEGTGLHVVMVNAPTSAVTAPII